MSRTTPAPISPAISKTPAVGASLYAATKFGLRGFALALHEDLRDTGRIRRLVEKPAERELPACRIDWDESLRLYDGRA